MNFDAAALSYVRYVLGELNLKPGALAQKSGISASTLTRALNDPKHKFKLSMTTLQKIADFSRINPAPFLEAQDTAELTLGTAHRPDLYKSGSPNEALNNYKLDVTLFIGDIAAGQWKEPSPFNYYDYGALRLTSVHHSPKDCCAYAVCDDSADMIAAMGEALFCIRIDKAEEERIENLIAKNKDSMWGYGPVIVERRSKDAFKVEITARMIRRRRDGIPGWELVSLHRADHSKADKKKAPLIPKVFIDRYGGNDEFRVLAAVQYVLRDTTDANNRLLFDRE